MERGRRDAALNRPFGCGTEGIGRIAVHAENKAAVDHHARRIQRADGALVILVEIGAFPRGGKVFAVCAFKANEGAAQPCIARQAYKAFVLRVAHGHRALKQPTHAAHFPKQRLRKRTAGEEIVVQKIEMPPGQRAHLPQNPVQRIGVKALPATEKGIHIAKIAGVRAAARDQHGIGHQVFLPLDKVAPGQRHIA